MPPTRLGRRRLGAAHILRTRDQLMRGECRPPVAIRRLGWLIVAPAAIVLASCGGMMPEMAAAGMMATAAPAVEPIVLPAAPPEAMMVPAIMLPMATPGI